MLDSFSLDILKEHTLLLLHGASLGVFLVLGTVLPRVRGIRMINRDVIQNVCNGLALFGFKILLLGAIFDKITPEESLFPVESLPWVLQFLLAFVLLDFSRYWLHYMGHRVPFLWRFHRVHHSAEVLDSTTGLRMHVVDFVQLQIIPLVIFAVVFSETGTADWVAEAALGMGIFFDCFQHSNMRWDVSKPFQGLWHKLLNNPHFHSWHHTRDGQLCDGNYSNTLIIWDRIFGTEVTQDHSPELLGLDGDQRIRNSFIGWQLLQTEVHR